MTCKLANNFGPLIYGIVVQYSCRDKEGIFT